MHGRNALAEKIHIGCFVGCFLLTLFMAATPVSGQREQQVEYTIRTAMGNITVVLFPDQAPVTAANFINYADRGSYDSSSFFRVCTPANEAGRPVMIEVIQGGEVSELKRQPPIALETTRQTGLSHTDGALSMARDAPHSATSSFFICIGNQPELDFGGKRNPDGQGFAVFGKVIDGMDVVRRIQRQAARDQYLINPVLIYSIDRR